MVDIYRMFVRPEGPEGERGAHLMATSSYPLAAEAIDLLEPLKEDASILEIGYGPGLGLAEALRAAPLGHITGVDHSALMQQDASKRNQSALDAGRLVVLVGTAARLPVATSSQDAAFMLDTLHFWPDPQPALVELWRVLRPKSPVVCGFTPLSGGPPPGLMTLFEDAGYMEIREGRSQSGYLLRATRGN